MKLFQMKSWGLIVVAMIVLTQNVDAKRLGGGMSLGRQSAPIARNPSAIPPKPAPSPVNAAPSPSAPAAAPVAPAPRPSRFGGMGGILGGLAAGIGLSYLFNSMGIGAGMSSMFSNLLMIGLLVFGGLWVYRKFFANKLSQSFNGLESGNMGFATATPQQSPSWSSGLNPTGHEANMASMATATSAQTSPSPSADNIGRAPIEAQLTPSSFADKDHFLENARTLFLQLQEASDQQNLETLKEFTSPELFTLLRKDMLARSTAISFTQVLTLAADLLAVEQENQEYMASVRFSGTIREEVNGPVADFQEIWNWTKPINGSTGWILSGIQQLN